MLASGANYGLTMLQKEAGIQREIAVVYYRCDGRSAKDAT